MLQSFGIAGQLEAAVADAFPGGSLDVAVSDGYFEVEMLQHGLLRPSAGEYALSAYTTGSRSSLANAFGKLLQLDPPVEEVAAAVPAN